MPTYRAPVKDMTFIINEVVRLQNYSNLPGFEDATPDIIQAILEEGGKLAEEVLQPINQSGDAEGCTRHDDGSVTTPKGFKEAFKLYAEGGWMGLSAATEYGGQGLPHVLSSAMEELGCGANLAFNMYPGLTHGAIAAISLAASDALKEKYLPKMIAGEWTGTMNLTEPHCGTDLGMMRSKAEPQSDGSYKITGTKIFISAGEHDLTENIIHLVLAKIPGGPEGIKGVSLFLVPKFMVNGDGSLGERNGVACGSIEEKMGIHANSTCVLNYDGATGWLVGEEHKGMRAMFIMMNAARLGVGIQGLGLSEVAYQNAVDYANDRLQGRALTGPVNEDGPADPIIVHPDVRRMLMDLRAFNEGARALALWTALQGDLMHKSPDEAERQRASDLMGLMTPVIKGVFTDAGYANATTAQQCYGGHGYIKEWGMEQFVRDARITQIYEGTNGIQAMDLVGRKLPRDGGRAVREYFALLQSVLEDAGADERMAEFIAPMQAAIADLQGASMWLMQNAMQDPNHAGAGATAYMHLLGLVALGHMWILIVKAAHEALDGGTEDPDFYNNKLITARYFFARMLPDTAADRRKVEAGAAPVMALAANAF